MTDKQRPPSRNADQFIVRFPDGMRDRIAELAKKNGRSMNAEIVARLELGLPKQLKDVPVVSGDIPWMMAQDIDRLARDAGVGFDEMLARIFIAGLHPNAPQVAYLPVLPGATGSNVRMVLKSAEELIASDATIVSEMTTRWSSAAGYMTPTPDPKK